MPEPIDLRTIPLGGETPRMTPEHELPAPHRDALPDSDPAGEAGEPEHPLRTALLTWEAPEFAYHPANAGILTKAGVLLIAGGFAAAFFKNFLFALLLAIAGGLIITQGSRRPRTLRLAVTSRGVAVGSRLYEFEELSSFWIFYDPPLFKELALQSKKTLMPMIRLPLGDLDPLRLREILLPFLKEQRQEASAIDVVAKRLGF